MPVFKTPFSSLIRTIRLSVGEVCMMYSQWSALKPGAIASPVNPPSLSVLSTLGTVPTVDFAPVAGSRWTMSCASRRL